MNGTTNIEGLTKFADRVTGLDNPWTRLPIVAFVALAVWLGLLTLCGFLLRGLVPEVSTPAAIDARLIELPGEGSPTSGGPPAASARNSSSSPATTAAVVTPQPPARKNKATHETRVQAKSDHPSKLLHKVTRLPSIHYPTADSSNALSPATVPSPPMVSDQLVSPKGVQGAAATNSSSPSTASTAGHKLGTGTGEGAGAGAGAGKGSGSGGGISARAIYAPVPSIPDDMRDEVMQATAVARFHVARDGSATVALISPTDFTSLDQIILDTLSHWRFQPAVRDGVAIESDAEVRLHITVQ
jgi:protein TonB